MQEPEFKIYNASAGSGKTFSIVVEYLKIVLLAKSNYEFSKILAITFTNKAAGEMKERIIYTLQDGANGQPNEIINAVTAVTKLDNSYIQQKCGWVLHAILQNYTSFQVATIDSFTLRLIRTFAHDLGLPVDFKLELELDRYLQETVDTLIEKVGKDTLLTDLLVSYVKELVLKDSSWNVSYHINKLYTSIMNDDKTDYVHHLLSLELPFYKKLKVDLEKDIFDFENTLKKYGEEGLQLLEPLALSDTFFPRKFVQNYFRKLINVDLENIFNNYIEKGLSEDKWVSAGTLNSKKAEDVNQVAAFEMIKEEFSQVVQNAKNYLLMHEKKYTLNREILKNIVPLAVLKQLNDEMLKIKNSENIRFNKEFNQLIQQQIVNEPVPYIYERLGEKYSYFFIDEMQDTSVLQWQNLVPLVENALSQGNGKLILVGDAKQSIYRWRGSDVTQFLSLSDLQNDEFNCGKKIVTLDTNYRSYEEVVNFNNDFFSFISGSLKNTTCGELYLQEKYQKVNAKKGGYIHIELLESVAEETDWNDDVDLDEEDEMMGFGDNPIYDKVLSYVNQAVENGFEKNEICILLRKRVEGTNIASFLISQGIGVSSADSLMLASHKNVRFFIAFLKWILDNKDQDLQFEMALILYEVLDKKQSKHEFLNDLSKAHGVEAFFEVLNMEFKTTVFYSLTLYDGLEYLIRCLGLESKSDVFIQSFLDVVLTFQMRYHTGITGFLDYWDKKSKNLKVELPPDKNKVQIMTIHKSKGLEFPVVIAPFELGMESLGTEQTWLPIPEPYQSLQHLKLNVSKAKCVKNGAAISDDILRDVQLENFNLVYVAYTRAVEQLFIVVNEKKTKKKGEVTGKVLSELLKNYIIYKTGIQQKSYSQGSYYRVSKSKNTEVGYSLQNFESIALLPNKVKVAYSIDKVCITYGNLVHQALSRLHTFHDKIKVIQYIKNQPIGEEMKQRAVVTIENVLKNPFLSQLFSEGLVAYNERSLLDAQGELCVPDRFLVFEEKVVLLDYKTGGPESKHKEQVRKYQILLTSIFKKEVEVHLVYLNDEINITQVI